MSDRDEMCVPFYDRRAAEINLIRDPAKGNLRPKMTTGHLAGEAEGERVWPQSGAQVIHQIADSLHPP